MYKQHVPHLFTLVTYTCHFDISTVGSYVIQCSLTDCTNKTTLQFLELTMSRVETCATPHRKKDIFNNDDIYK